jgi:hypothetical protein
MSRSRTRSIRRIARMQNAGWPGRNYLAISMISKRLGLHYEGRGTSAAFAVARNQKAARR